MSEPTKNFPDAAGLYVMGLKAEWDCLARAVEDPEVKDEEVGRRLRRLDKMIDVAAEFGVKVTLEISKS